MDPHDAEKTPCFRLASGGYLARESVCESFGSHAGCRGDIPYPSTVSITAEEYNFHIHTTPLEFRQTMACGSNDNGPFFVKPKIATPPPVAAPVVPINLPPPQPVAPPLPFTYLGKMSEEGKLTVYVAKADKNYVLRGDEVIDGMYTVESIDAQKIVFLYNPLKTEQVLIIRGAN